MKIRTRFYIGFIALVAVLSLVAIFVLSTYTRILSIALPLESDVFPGTVFLLETKGNLLFLQSIAAEIQETGNVDLWDGTTQIKVKLITSARGHTLHEAGVGHAEADDARDIEVRINRIIRTLDNVVAGVAINDSPEELAELRNIAQAEINALTPILDTHVLEHQGEMTTALDQVQEATAIGSRVLWIGMGLAVLSAAVISAYLLRSVLRPLGRLEEGARQLGGGNLSYRVDLHKGNEFGQVGTAFNNMAESLEQNRNDLQVAYQLLEQRLRDIQDARQLAEEAKAASEIKSAFLASMSHELRTPLNAVINFTKFVVKGDLGPVNEQQSEMLYEVVDSAKHLLALINDVLDMSKIEAGTLNLFVEDNVYLRGLIESAVNTSKPLLEDKPVELRVNIDPALPAIRADRQRILQIMLNIVSNACKFTQQGSITIDAGVKGDEVLIAIADTGPGIAPEDQTLVFEAFKQTQTGLRQGGGTGLGMPISRSLAEAHGGRLWLESQPGKGTTFFVTLPIKAAHLTPAFAASLETA